MREQLIPILVVALAVVACNSSNGDGDGDGDGDIDAGLDALPGPECPDTALSPPADHRFLDHIPASEDFALDADGFAIGVAINGGALIRTRYAAGAPETIAPSVSSFGRGTRILPGGDIVVADPDSGVILRFAANGSSTPIASLVDPNGIAVDLAGMVYATSGSGRVIRVDPDSGDVIDLHSSPGRTFDGIAFSPDFRTLYFNQESGEVGKIPIDASGAAGPVAPHAMITPEFLLDGMTTDACGNLYVIEMAGVVWRVTPEGAVEMWLDLRGENPFIPAINFGSGHGGWSDTSIYVMNLNGGIFEAELGVPGRLDPHLR